jgi:hypothetical protein
LIDKKETLIGTNKSLADTDGDGLKDGIEVNELGTSPKQKDTDGDLISDQREVRRTTRFLRRGFTGTNRHWYLNPLDPDTNGDSRADFMECSQLIDIKLSNNTLVTPAGTACEDTDGDTVPDVFDYDDDNDQVPDSLDSAPTTVMAGSWDAGNTKYTGVLSQTVNLQLNGFTANKPLLVDIELRPTDPNHLWYTQNVLDWPSNDKEGQVRRVHDTTFGASGRDANGDMRLIPMVELEIPYRNGHYGNFPVTSKRGIQVPLRLRRRLPTGSIRRKPIRTAWRCARRIIRAPCLSMCR